MLAGSTDVVGEALVKYGYGEISNQQLAEHMGFSSEEQRMLTMFWEPAFNSGWIYLSPEMITVDMGYKKVSDFYKAVLRSNYVENTDYIEIEKTNELVKAYEEYKQSLNVEPCTVKNIPNAIQIALGKRHIPEANRKNTTK